jgi:hypothetical protein
LALPHSSGLLVLGGIGKVLGRLLPSNRCDLCQNLLRKVRYKWKLHGKEVTVCTHCNSTLEREQSKSANRKLKGR